MTPFTRPPMTGTHEDLRSVQAALAWLHPHCPRCGRADITPLTWYDVVIWFQCARCYKLWREVLQELIVAAAEPASARTPTEPITHVACDPQHMLAFVSKVRRISGHIRPLPRRRVADVTNGSGRHAEAVTTIR